MPHITAHSFLTLHYRLSGPQGDVINTFADKPATLSLGTGELAPALEQHLLGLEEGAHTTLHLEADAAFGAHNPQMLQWISAKMLTEHGDPMDSYSVGEVVQFPLPSGQGHYAAAVREVKGERILLDFNHPLAGHPVTFEVKVIAVL